MNTLIEVLEESAKRNGPDKVLTVGHLLNILKLAERIEEKKGEADVALVGYILSTDM